MYQITKNTSSYFTESDKSCHGYDFLLAIFFPESLSKLVSNPRAAIDGFSYETRL